MKCSLVTRVVILLAALLSNTALAQKLEGRNAADLKRDFSNAITSGTIVSSLRAKIVKRQVVFDVELVPNDNKSEWMALLNLTAQQFQQAKNQYSQVGYVVGPNTSVSANGEQYYSAIWIKAGNTKPTLVLPSEPIPVTGNVVPSMRKVDAAIQKFLLEHNVAGATIAVARNGKLSYERGFGWSNIRTKQRVQPGTPMRISGTSKLITAVATLQLVQDGTLPIDEPILPLLVEAGARGAKTPKDRRWHSLTPRHLLQHTAGWNAAVTPDPMFQTATVSQELLLKKPAKARDIIRYQLGQRLNFSPGKQYAHSEFGYALLGRLIEIKAKRLYHHHVRERVLKPAGMSDTKIGKTRLKDRYRGETNYYMQRLKTGAAFWSASVSRIKAGSRTIATPDIVAAPDGAFDVETMAACSGWTSTASDLCRLMLAIDREREPLLNKKTRLLMKERSELMKKAPQWYGCGIWVSPNQSEGPERIWHGGLMAGSSAIVVQRTDGIVWSAVFNTDVDPSGQPIAKLVETTMDESLNKVEWD